MAKKLGNLSLHPQSCSVSSSRWLFWFILVLVCLVIIIGVASSGGLDTIKTAKAKPGVSHSAAEIVGLQEALGSFDTRIATLETQGGSFVQPPTEKPLPSKFDFNTCSMFKIGHWTTSSKTARCGTADTNVAYRYLMSGGCYCHGAGNLLLSSQPFNSEKDAVGYMLGAGGWACSCSKNSPDSTLSVLCCQ